MDEKQNGFKICIVIGVLLAAFVSTYIDPCTWTEVTFSSEALFYQDLDTDRLSIDDHSKSIAGIESQSIRNVLGFNFFLPFFLFQIPPYKKAFALRC
jgi:hypothetical protein